MIYNQQKIIWFKSELNLIKWSILIWNIIYMKSNQRALWKLKETN